MNNGQHPPFPAEAYPRGVYAADQHVTPDTVYAASSETSLMLWVAGLNVGVARDADDTRLQAAMHLAWHVGQMAERYGSMVRAELEQRHRERAAEPIAAAARAAHHGRPAPATAPAAGEVLPPPPAPTPATRYCTGCGAQLRPATPEETAAAKAGQEPQDTRGDCPNCRVEFLADQVRTRASAPPAPVLPETALMPIVAADPDNPNGERPR
ncbi:hypothetical protein ACQEVF_25105 [Nonomuraea polychroma]|uniref:hypothetical protein n=1 Tax=Nonomuraea polychroma TaxID=46176 RepID=UPI003D8A3E89